MNFNYIGTNKLGVAIPFIAGHTFLLPTLITYTIGVVDYVAIPFIAGHTFLPETGAGWTESPSS